MNAINNNYIGKVRYQFDELGSTNDFARSLCYQPHVPEGTAVLAARQTAGRGQMGTTWESAPGLNLTLSVLLYPHTLRPDQQAILGKAVALAVFETVAQWLPAPALCIKWPNDLWYNERKLAGILIENIIGGQSLTHSIVGIGINANQIQFSPSLAGSVTSIQQITGQPCDTALLADQLFAHLENRYEQVKNGHFAAVQGAYLSHLLGLGQVRWFQLPDGTPPFAGTITEVDEWGRLCVEANGETRRFGVKEVSWVNPQTIHPS